VQLLTETKIARRSRKELRHGMKKRKEKGGDGRGKREKRRRTDITTEGAKNKGCLPHWNKVVDSKISVA